MNNLTSRNWIVRQSTVIALAAIATSITVGFHEGIHAVTCAVVGGDVNAYTSLYVDCISVSVLEDKFVAGSASIANIVLGLSIYLWIRPSRATTPKIQFFLWLFMLMNLLHGAGYWMVSGIANFGDWATVIANLNPHWMYRVGMTLLGSITFMGFIILSLKEFGKIIGGKAPEQYARGRTLLITSYVTAILVIALAGIFSPLGFTGIPSIAGIFAAIGAFSPLLWMTEWFQAKMFVKINKEALVVPTNQTTVISAIIILIVYAICLNSSFSIMSTN